MGGLEFLQHYDAANPAPKAKVLIFTNMENSPEVAEAYKLGAHRCIIKSWTAPHNLAHELGGITVAGNQRADVTLNSLICPR